MKRCLYCNSYLKIVDFKKRAKIFFTFTIFIVALGIGIFGLNITDLILLTIGIYISYKLNKKGLAKTCTNKNCANSFK